MVALIWEPKSDLHAESVFHELADLRDEVARRFWVELGPWELLLELLADLGHALQVLGSLQSPCKGSMSGSQTCSRIQIIRWIVIQLCRDIIHKYNATSNIGLVGKHATQIKHS